MKQYENYFKEYKESDREPTAHDWCLFEIENHFSEEEQEFKFFYFIFVIVAYVAVIISSIP